MSEQKRMAILESIMAVAWADGEHQFCERHLIDGIVGMEGNGPSGGEPRPLGALVAGAPGSIPAVTGCRRGAHLSPAWRAPEKTISR